MKKFYYIIYIGVLMLFASSCQQEDTFSPENSLQVNIVYQIQMEDGLLSRSIGDGKQVDELIVGIFRDNILVNILKFMDEADGEKDGKFTNIAIPMMNKENYDLVFWAHKSGNGIYTIDGEFNVKVDYTKYTDITLTDTESFEAFTTQIKNVSVYNPGNKNIKLSRPFGQLNIGVTEGVDVSKVSKIEMKVKGVPTVYHPLDNSSSNAKDLQLLFKGSTVTEMLEINNENYTYLATMFMLPVSNTEAEITIYQSNTQIKMNVDKVTLVANERTNIVGNLLE